MNKENNVLSSYESSIKDEADKSIERISNFLSKKDNYNLCIKPDPANTGKIWIISLSNNVNEIHLITIYDGTYLSAVKAAKFLSLVLQIFGFTIKDKENEDFEYTEDEKEYSSFIEKLKWNINLNLYIKTSNVFKSFFLCCKTSEEDIVLFEIGGISEKSINILCTQFCILLASLGKNIISPDESSLTRFGVVDLCPSKDTEKENIWRISCNSIQLISLGEILLDRIELDPINTKYIEPSISSRFLLMTNSVTHFNSFNYTIIDNTVTINYIPLLKISVSSIEREAHSNLEVEEIIKEAVKNFINNFGITKMKMRIVKRHFSSSGKYNLAIIIEDV